MKSHKKFVPISSAATIYSHQTMRYDWIFAATCNQRSTNNGPNETEIPDANESEFNSPSKGSFPMQRAGNDPAFRTVHAVRASSVLRPYVMALNGAPIKRLKLRVKGAANITSEGCAG